ncbi:ecdysone oxidase-like [Leguminivora glycinivorella]|uniref:ecdysone oxidase-like n=1 Tax=Leguminivora glycinivorella TaxID=1035111 RepID=UPI00200C248E|nr:ecdysone oxidase-like [Leguminivora glycinivorella]
MTKMLFLGILLLSVMLVDGHLPHELPDYVLPDSVPLKDGDSFDYIVVGAGGAGTPAAARLALSGASVLLVEAGGDPNLNTRIPGLYSTLLGSALDWQYPTVTNNMSCLSSAGKQCPFGRGKCLGGSTSINFMMYVRGNHRDYNELGFNGWAWEDLKPYFLKYEGLRDLNKLPYTSIPYHNTTGTMKIGFFANPENSWHSRTIRGYRHLNFPYNYDVNAKSQIGISQVIGYVHEGERMSTARGYLARDDVKSALKVTKNTHCTGVILDKRNNAIGIKAVVKGRTLQLYARKEVIISAGTIGTPQILMLSGIGPKAHLKDLGIPVRADLPVGDSLTDHVFPQLYVSVNPDTSMPSQDEAMERWLYNRTGPLASIDITDLTAFLNTRCYDVVQRKLIYNSSDCEISTMQLANSYIGLYQPSSSLNEGIAQQLTAANKNKALIFFWPLVLRPFSRGSIRLASRDPLQKPSIFPNYLSDERDVDEMLRGITIVEHLIETPEYKARNASIVHLKLPGCPEYANDREGYWRCYCRHMTSTVLHAVGTARLGPVMDPQQRVHGVKRLRVADLSVLPEVPRGNTAAVAIAIGERVADVILKDAKKC